MCNIDIYHELDFWDIMYSVPQRWAFERCMHIMHYTCMKVPEHHWFVDSILNLLCVKVKYGKGQLVSYICSDIDFGITSLEKTNSNNLWIR